MKYKIAYLSSKNPHDRTLSSGVYYYQSRAIAKYCGEVIYLGPVHSWLIVWVRNFFSLYGLLFPRKKLLYSHDIVTSWIYSRLFRKRLRKTGIEFDFIFADKASNEIAFLKTDFPIIYSTDATYDSMRNYYPAFQNLSSFADRNARKIEQNVLDKAALVICASLWAADSAKRVYKATPEKVHVIPRGSNLESPPSRDIVLSRNRGETCHLLFMGSAWKRKGYPIALQTYQLLKKQGLEVSMTAVGFTPSSEYYDSSVKIVPYLNKNSENGRKEFDELLMGASFFFLPTRAECQGISFCEASAYGLPVIATNTGGVSDVVLNGVNGYALPFEATPEDYADKIREIYEDEQHWRNLVKSGRDYYENRLNWDVWGRDFKHIIDNHFGKRNLVI